MGTVVCSLLWVLQELHHPPSDSELWGSGVGPRIDWEELKLT